MRGHARVRHGIKPCQAFLPVSPTGRNFGFLIYTEPDKMTGVGGKKSLDFCSILLSFQSLNNLCGFRLDCIGIYICYWRWIWIFFRPVYYKIPFYTPFYSRLNIPGPIFLTELADKSCRELADSASTRYANAHNRPGRLLISVRSKKVCIHHPE